jgi:hypothetical protein
VERKLFAEPKGFGEPLRIADLNKSCKTELVFFIGLGHQIRTKKNCCLGNPNKNPGTIIFFFFFFGKSTKSKQKTRKTNEKRTEFFEMFGFP